MNGEHENWREQGEIYALGALDGQELKEFEAHLASGCAICEAYVRETRETLTLLHRTLQPTMPSASVKARLVEQITAEKVVPLAVRAKATRPRWRIMVGTLAAGIVGAVLTGVLVTKRYEPRHSVYTAVIDLSTGPLHERPPALWRRSDAESRGAISLERIRRRPYFRHQSSARA